MFTRMYSNIQMVEHGKVMDQSSQVLFGRRVWFYHLGISRIFYLIHKVLKQAKLLHEWSQITNTDFGEICKTIVAKTHKY